MQAQILGENLRSLYGVILRLTPGSNYEQAILVYTWRAEPRITYPGGFEERKSYQTDLRLVGLIALD